MIPFPDAAARPQSALILAGEKGASTIRSASVTIPLPRVGGVSYAFREGFLLKDGKPQPPRFR